MSDNISNGTHGSLAIPVENTVIGNLANPEKIYGKSAYEIAVKNGFEGTEEEWLESLKGYTPQKGVDYFTEADKDEFVAEVLSRLPIAEEVSV